MMLLQTTVEGGAPAGAGRGGGAPTLKKRFICNGALEASDSCGRGCGLVVKSGVAFLGSCGAVAGLCGRRGGVVVWWCGGVVM